MNTGYPERAPTGGFYLPDGFIEKLIMENIEIGAIVVDQHNRVGMVIDTVRKSVWRVLLIGELNEDYSGFKNRFRMSCDLGQFTSIVKILNPDQWLGRVQL